MTWPAHVSIDDWAIDRPVGGLGRTPILRQKQLRGKTVKTRHAGSIKRALAVHSRNNGRGEQKKGGRKTRGYNKRKKVRKWVKDNRENKKLRKEKGIRKEKQRVSKSVIVGMDQ